jgi:hypothetical protein
MRSMTRIFFTLALFTALGIAGRAQTVTGTTTIDLDPDTGTITATCETDLDGTASEFYGAQVECTVKDGNRNQIAQRGYDDTFGEGYAQVVLTFQGVPGNVYFATGSHLAFTILSRDEDEGHPTGYYDDYYNLEQISELVETNYDYYPGLFSFTGPGPETDTRQHTITIANTNASVADPTNSVAAQVDWGGSFTATDLLYSYYVGIVGSTQLGLYGGEFGPGSNGCVIGTEGVGTVTPRNATGPITLKRFITSLACYAGPTGHTPIACPIATSTLPSDDTGTNVETNPQEQTPRGPAAGQIFNMDVPGITYSENPNTDIIRVRYNFLTYAVDSDGKTVISNLVPYFVRLSCNNSNGVAQLLPVSLLDNSVGSGTTPISWNLQ